MIVSEIDGALVRGHSFFPLATPLVQQSELEPERSFIRMELDRMLHPRECFGIVVTLERRGERWSAFAR